MLFVGLIKHKSKSIFRISDTTTTWLLGVSIMGIDRREALVGDLVVKINHRGFDTKAQVWMKIHDGIGKWNKVAQF
jgi:hypothetical protein